MQTENNERRVAQAYRLLKEAIEAATAKGFHGVVSVSVHVQDGTINHVKRSSEQIHK